MKKLFLAAVALGALSIASTDVMAHNHDDKGYKGKMMEKVDTDGDGAISKEEFMAKHEEKFTKMDTDADGLISKEEHKAAKMERKEKMKEKMGKMKEMKDKMKDKSAY